MSDETGETREANCYEFVGGMYYAHQCTRRATHVLTLWPGDPILESVSRYCKQHGRRAFEERAVAPRIAFIYEPLSTPTGPTR